MTSDFFMSPIIRTLVLGSGVSASSSLLPNRLNDCHYEPHFDCLGSRL